MQAVPAGALDCGGLEKAQQEQSVLRLIYEHCAAAVAILEGGVVVAEVDAPEFRDSMPSWLTVPGGPAPLWPGHSPDARSISGGGVRVTYGNSGFGLEITAAGGGDALASVAAEGGLSWDAGGAYTLAFDRREGERFFGGGEPLPPVYYGLAGYELDGRVEIWNIHRAPSRLRLPFYFSRRGYGVFIDNPWKAALDFGRDSVIYEAAGGPVRFYIIKGRGIGDVLERYTALTGRPPMPPRWAAGYMQSRYGYENEADFRRLMDEFRSRRIPCDVLILDLDWFGRLQMGNLWWKEENFPDGPGLLAEFEERGFKSILITEPYIFKESYNFAEADSRGLLVRNEKGETNVFPFWSGKPAGLLDFTNVDAQRWYGDRVARIHDAGCDGWWTDLNEPEKDDTASHYLLGPREAAHNIQALLMNKAIYDTYDRLYPDERTFIMSRSGFSGIQRYGSGVWSGDVDASFHHLANQVPIGIAASISGLSMWNSDTGGFHGEPSPELFTRWVQFSAFNPVFRSHGNHSIREPWAFGAESERINKKYIELRYRLIPYLYTLYHRMHETGAPIMMPTFMAAPGDEKSYSQAGQFMYGPQLLVAPVVEAGAQKKRVYLPPGEWTYFWNDRKAAGPKTIGVPVDLETMPLFVRQGALLPMGPVMQYSREKKTDPLTVHYYPSPRETSFALYEDDGETRAYERGEFALTELRGVSAPGESVRVGIGAPEGRYEGMPAARDYEVVIHQCAPPAKVLVSGSEAGGENVSYDDKRDILTVTVPGSPGGFEVEVLF